jgi:acylphosphatase
MTTDSAVRMEVYGEVQGVGFRWYVARRAETLNLRGYVRNTSNGGVEIHAEGDRARLETLLEAVKVGPRSARVADVHTIWSAPTGTYEGFEIRH